MADHKPRRAKRVLHDLTISEVSAVDRGAGEGCHVVLAKRDDRNTAFAQLMRKIFDVEPFNPRKNLDVSVDPDGDINPGGAKEPLFPPPDDDDETTDNEEELQMKSRSEELSEIAKKYGISAICKRVLEKNDLPINEHELVGMMSEDAARSNSTFAKRFAAQDAQGVLWRRAVDAVKQRQWIGAAGAW